MNAARNQAVFHFIPETFADAISQAPQLHSPFLSGRGKRRGNVHYAYADVVAGEILVGLPSNTEQFFSVLGDAMSKTRDLVNKFTDEAEILIAHHLKQRGFEKEQGQYSLRWGPGRSSGGS